MANITDNVDETELDEDKRYEQYTREIEYLDKLQIANTGDFGRAIRYFSGFAIPIFLTITDISSSKTSAIWWTAGIFLLAILCSMIAHSLSDFGINKRRPYVELFWIQQKHEYRFKQHWTAQCAWLLGHASFVLFLCGVALFIWFLINGSLIIKEV